MHFVYVRIASLSVCVSYLGNREYNIEDFQDLTLTLPHILYRRKLWSILKFQERLKKDLIRKLFGQLGESLASFLAYKTGLTGLRKQFEEKNQTADDKKAKSSSKSKKKDSGKDNRLSRALSYTQAGTRSLNIFKNKRDKSPKAREQGANGSSRNSEKKGKRASAKAQAKAMLLGTSSN